MAAAPRRIPASRAEVRALLGELGFRAHKRFGQNFLADAGVLDRIVARSGVGPGSVVLEVGPGLGTLTRRLRDAGALVVAVEIDHGLARHLRAAFAGDDGLLLVEADAMAGKGRWSPDVVAALQSVLARRPGPGFDVVSNLPYGISTSFLTSLAHEPGPPRRATVMLQLEVARALGASAGDDDYSALSVFVRTYFDVRREFEVGRHAFFPEPDVDSAVVGLVPRSAPGPEPGAFGRFVQALFQARRKAIGTSLRGIAGSGVAELLAAAGFDPRARVDGLEPERIAVLFGEFSAWRPAS